MLAFFRSPTFSGYFYAALAAVLWSLIGPLSKGALGAGVPPLEVAFWRALLGGCFFAIQAAVTGALFIPLRDAVVFFLFGAWGIGVLFGALLISIDLSGAAMAMVLMYTAPLWVAVASRVFFHEAISPRKCIAIGVALIGVVLICFSGGSLPKEYSLLGIVCGFVCGVAYASHFPFYTWWRDRYGTDTLYTYMLLGGAAALLPFIDFVPGKSMVAWGNMIALSFLTNYLAYMAFGRSLRLISQVQSAVIGNIEPILATIWVAVFFGENFSLAGWIGCTLVLGAVFLLTVEGGRKKHALS